MSDVFVPLDLNAYLNCGPENVETTGGYLWPSAPGTPALSGLNRLPGGDCRFWGIPFALAERDKRSGGPSFIVVSGQAGKGDAGSVSIEVGRKARRVLFAHVCTPVSGAETSLEGTGEVVGRYRLRYDSGIDVAQALRRRFEIHDLFVPWGHHPFLCRNCREFLPVGLDDRSVPYGAAQVGVRSESSDLTGWWLYDWVNPHPEASITTIEVSAPAGAAVALGGITLCHEESDPLVWHPRSEVAVSTESREEIAVDMDRGVIARRDRLYVPGADFIESENAGWGSGGQVFQEGRYLEVHGSREGRLNIRCGDASEAFRWGDVLKEKTVQRGATRVALIAPAGRQWVHVRVNDAAAGRPVGCRIHFRSPHGAYFAPHGHQADVNTAWFEDMGGDCKVHGTPYAYIDGTCQVELPVGPVYVEVARGFEYVPLRKLVEVKPGQRNLTLEVERAFDMKDRGFYSGDTHVHFLSSQSAHLEAAGEDLNVVNLLASQWGRLFTSWEEFTGGLAPTSSEFHKIWVSQENRQHVLGHISLLGLKEMVAPMCTGGPQEDWIGGEVQVLIADWAEACREQGGLVIMPHMPTPDFENAANIVLGQADAAEMCWIWKGEKIGAGERGYYRWLNTGQKLPIVGGTDKMSNERILGGSRTYAKLTRGEEFTFDNWCKAVKNGTTFASTGAMIDLRVEGTPMGGEIALPGNGGTLDVVATAESVWPLTAVELIVNGERAARQQAAGDGRTVTLQQELSVEKSCWVAARCWGEFATDAGPVMAHSSPVYIDVGNRCAFEPADGEYLLTHMEGGIAWAENIGVFRDENARARLIALFRRACEELSRRAP